MSLPCRSLLLVIAVLGAGCTLPVVGADIEGDDAGAGDGRRGAGGRGRGGAFGGDETGGMSGRAGGSAGNDGSGGKGGFGGGSGGKGGAGGNDASGGKGGFGGNGTAGSGGTPGTGGTPGSGGMPGSGVDAGAAPDATPPDHTPSTAAPVFNQNFEALAVGSSWLKSCKWVKHAHVTDGCGVGGGKCLRVAQDPVNKEPPLFPLPPEEQRPPYPAGSAGVCFPYYTNTGTDVVQAVQPLPPALEYSLNYDVFFEPGYDWARAGKLPGLSAKEWDSGCSIEGDGLKTDPGAARWSVRAMWRDLGTNELYVYDQDRMPGACGSRAPTPTPFAVGKWMAITIYVKVNTTAAARDGAAEMYMDGKVMRAEFGLRLRATDSKNALISNIFFSTFFGGNESKRLYCAKNPGDPMYCAVPDPRIDVTWVPKKTSYVDFDNLAVYPGWRVRSAPGQ